MLSINMRVFKTVLLIAFFGTSVRCLPVTDKSTESKTESKIETESKVEITSVEPQKTAVTSTTSTSTYSDTTDYYDQRQNGSENYRLHLDGFVFVIAPFETLLLAGAAAAGNSEPNFSISNQNISPIQSIGELNKPANDNVHNKTDLATSKTIHKQPATVRLANFLAPLIRRIRHVRVMSVH